MFKIDPKEKSLMEKAYTTLFPNYYVEERGFLAKGFAQTIRDSDKKRFGNKSGMLKAEIWYQQNFVALEQVKSGKYLDVLKTPTFQLFSVTTDLLAGLMHEANSFDFSAHASSHLGRVNYDLGKTAGDHDGSADQDFASMFVNGSWTKDGLELKIAGDLAGHGWLTNKPTAPNFRSDKFEIELTLHWDLLRFWFFQEKYKIIDAYRAVHRTLA